MRNARNLFALAISITTSQVHAEVTIGNLRGYSMAFEGLLQLDRTRYNHDRIAMINDGEVRAPNYS